MAAMQLTLIDPAPAARQSDPATSHQAAAQAVAKIPGVSIEVLRQHLTYDPESGVLTWIKCKRRDMVGRPAGTTDANGYVCVKVVGRTYKASRIAWALTYGDWPSRSDCIDHIDLNKSNNRLSNLRIACLRDNRRNNRGNRGTASGLKGAYAHHGRWRAIIESDGNRAHLGTFDTAIEAHEAYMRESARRYGEFHCEMERAGLIVPTGKTVKSTAGRSEREWRAV